MVTALFVYADGRREWRELSDSLFSFPYIDVPLPVKFHPEIVLNDEDPTAWFREPTRRRFEKFRLRGGRIIYKEVGVV